MNVIQKITEATKLLDELEEYSNSISELQSVADSKLSDLYHFIENNNLSASQACNIVKEIKLIRQGRRKLLNDKELFRVYTGNINKMLKQENRQFLLAELNKTSNNLGTKYRNRVYSEEEFVELGIIRNK